MRTLCPLGLRLEGKLNQLLASACQALLGAPHPKECRGAGLPAAAGNVTQAGRCSHQDFSGDSRVVEKGAYE